MNAELCKHIGVRMLGEQKRRYKMDDKKQLCFDDEYELVL